MKPDTTKTITVMHADADACLARWERKGWNPISATKFEERDKMNRRRVIQYVTIVFAKMGKPK